MIVKAPLEIDKYRILEKLEENNYTVVYKTKDRDDNPLVLKIARTGIYNDIISREFQILAQCKHPNIIQVYDYDKADDGRVFFTLEYIAGQSIHKYFQGYSKEFLAAILQIIEALGSIHEKGFVHSDLKPEHILYLAEQRKAVLIDFGFAAEVNQKIELAGTIDYMAPEVLKGIGLDSRTDLYSLGVILYEILGGKKPHAIYKPLPGITEELNNAISSLLSKEPALRPTTIDLYKTISKYLPQDTLKKPTFKIGLPKTGFVKIPEIFDILSNTRGKMITLFGDSGYGKTRLLNELKFNLLMNGYEALFFIPKPGTNLLNALSKFLGHETFDFSKYDDRVQIYDEILSQLLISANGEKIAIMIDDAENLSDYELGLLRYIGYGISDTNITVIGASKPEKRIKKLGFENLVMRPFTINETHELLEKTFLNIEPIIRFNKWLFEYSGGNPLFIVEILNNLFESNILSYQSGAWRVDEQSLNKIKTPPKIEELLKNRIRNSAVHGQEILKAIALCDTPIDITTLNSFTKSETHISIEHLKTYDLLKEEIIDNQLCYFISNQILKQITKDSIAENEKKSLRQRLLEAIHKTHPEDNRFMPTSAELYDALDNNKQASVYYLKAAQNAEKIYDYESSLKYYQKQETCIKDVESEKYSQLLLKMANLTQLMGNNRQAIDYYNKALSAKNPDLEKGIHLRLGFANATMGEYGEAVRHYKNALDLMTNKETKEFIQTINYLGYAMLYLNKFKDAETYFDEALTIAKHVNDLGLQAESQYYQAVLEWFQNNYDTGIEKAKKNLKFTKGNQLSKQYAYGANLLSSFYQQKNDLLTAQKFLDEAITTFNNVKHINSLCGALCNQGLLNLQQGNFPAAKELFNNTLMLAQQIDNQIIQYISIVNLAHINKKLGKFDEATNFYQKAANIDSEKPEPFYNIAINLHRKGEIDKAKTLLEQKFATNKGILYYLGLAVVDAILGKHESGEKLMSEGLNKLETENSDTETKVEAFLSASQFYHETGSFEKSLAFALKLKELTNSLSREYSIADALIKINNYNLKLVDGIDINKEIARLKEIGCIYDWAWLKKLRLESIINRGIEPTQIKYIAKDLNEIQDVFKSLGAHLELNRTKEIQERLFPIIVHDYSRRTISTEYLKTFSDLAGLISQHLGDEDFIQKTLDLVVQTTHAERGALFIKTQKGLEFGVGRNIDRTTIKDATELSKSAIDAVDKEQIIFSLDAVNDPNFSSRKSVMLQQIRSLLCIPLVVFDNVIGAIYLDSRITSGIFGPEDKDFLLTVSQILGAVIEKSLVFKQLSNENILLRGKILPEIGTGYLLGKSKQMKKIYEQIEDIAHTGSPVLITGETGTGKGMIARLIHLKSKRREKKFLSINCGTVTETLFESELFGHKKGSFTGAINDKKGLLEEAEAGTVFLDEISNTSIAFQSKLLEAIEDKVIRRVGETNTRKIDVRFLFATNRDLDIEVEDGRFRKDLFYRINVFKIDIPPLREREIDIPLLAQFFLEKYSKEVNKKIDGFASDCLTLLKTHFWPGNVRELQNVIERAVIRAKNNTITRDDIGLEKKKELVVSLKEIKKEAIIEALNTANWNILKAAKLLDISPKTIHRYIKKYQIQVR